MALFDMKKEDDILHERRILLRVEENILQGNVFADHYSIPFRSSHA